MQMNQQVTFLSDGDEKLRELVFGLNPNTEYLLDWFHITMRISEFFSLQGGGRLFGRNIAENGCSAKALGISQR